VVPEVGQVTRVRVTHQIQEAHKLQLLRQVLTEFQEAYLQQAVHLLQDPAQEAL